MASDLRIALIGQAAFGESVLGALLDRGEDVISVWCPPDKAGSDLDPLKRAAQAAGIPVHQFKRMRDAEAIRTFAGLGADLGVMAFVTDIVPAEIINAPARGTINFHPSLLPKHRGPSSINWPIIQGETVTGLTVFWPDAGLDTGPILLQKRVEIGPYDTLGNLYFKKIFPLGVASMVEAVEMIRAGTAPQIEQDESQATYEGWCRAESAFVDWKRPIAEVYNLVRGTDPSPGASTVFNGRPLRLFDAGKVDGETGKRPGEIAGVDADGFRVAAPGGALLVRRVQPDQGKKVSAPEWMAAANVGAGTRLGG